MDPVNAERGDCINASAKRIESATRQDKEMDAATPKVNANTRQQFISQNVSMIGKCVSVTQDKAVLEADGQVPVSFNKVSLQSIGRIN